MVKCLGISGQVLLLIKYLLKCRNDVEFAGLWYQISSQFVLKANINLGYKQISI